MKSGVANPCSLLSMVIACVTKMYITEMRAGGAKLAEGVWKWLKGVRKWLGVHTSHSISPNSMKGRDAKIMEAVPVSSYQKNI